MKTLPGLSGKYGCIYADPAWEHYGNSKAKPGRNPRRHYKTMKLPEIAAMPVRDYVADDCHLFMWITGPLFVTGAHLPIFEAWGFRPSSVAFVWVKNTKKSLQGNFFEALQQEHFRMGPGHTTRQNAEYCLLGRRGKPARCSASVRQVFAEPIREHSRKPDHFPGLIETYTGDVRKAELFARTQRPNWDVWGNEINKFEAVG